jgi:5'-3' exonuclease
MGSGEQGRVLLAVDGNSLVHRSFHAQAHTGLRTPDGRPMWAVRGLLAQLVAAVERIGPDVVVVGFDDAEVSSRRNRWPQYKAARSDKLPTLVEQLELAADVLRGLGIAVVVPRGLEADDVLASAARFAPTVGATTVVMTSDRDAFALIDDHTRVLRIINGGVEASPLLTCERLMMMLGIRPDQYRDYSAMRGDPSDNLPGVRGIGPKTAARLLAELGTARAAFDDMAGDGARVRAAIGAGAARHLAHADARTAWELNCQVMHMQDDVPLDLRSTGPGCLPLAGPAVRASFEAHQLTTMVNQALRVLAGQETPAPTPHTPWPPMQREVAARRWPAVESAAVAPDGRARSWTRARGVAKLAGKAGGRTPAVAGVHQPSLFD